MEDNKIELDTTLKIVSMAHNTMKRRKNRHQKYLNKARERTSLQKERYKKQQDA